MARQFRLLTRPAIRALKAGKKITEGGITAAKLGDGDVRYSVNVMADGERIHRVIGLESNGTTRSQAEEFISKVRSDARAGRLQLPKGRKTHLTFRDAANRYLVRLEETSGRNITQKRSHVSLHLAPFFANQRIDGITTFTVDRFKKRRNEEGASNATINRDLATLSHLFSKATEWGWLAKRPCKITKLVESQGRIIALTDKQSAALIRAAMADEEPDVWLFILYGLNTAMRHSEILRARFEHLDLDQLRQFVPRAKAGTREQPITPELADVLRREREMRDDRIGWIFPTPRPNASLTGHRFRMAAPFRRAVTKAGLDPSLVTPHVMRHTAITNLVKAGVDLPTIQRISGHKTLAMVLRYTHIHGPHIDQAMRTIGLGIPERAPNEAAGTTTPELHRTPKRPA